MTDRLQFEEHLFFDKLWRLGVVDGKVYGVPWLGHSMELLDILKYGDRYPFDLSGGQMQRMAIASIIAMQPQVIILDEPTSQLDPQGREEVFQAVQKLSKRGITIILVEHNMEKIAEYSDRVVLLDDGKLIAADTPQRIFSRDDLDTYGVEAPVYTQICRALGLRDDGTGGYPVTLTAMLRGKRS